MNIISYVRGSPINVGAVRHVGFDRRWNLVAAPLNPFLLSSWLHEFALDFRHFAAFDSFQNDVNSNATTVEQCHVLQVLHTFIPCKTGGMGAASEYRFRARPWTRHVKYFGAVAHDGGRLEVQSSRKDDYKVIDCHRST